MENYAMSGRDTPELVVKFWPPSVTARGSEAIRAIRRPLAFIIFTRPFVFIAVVWLLPSEHALTWIKQLIGFY
jgi:hypothetical protein